MTRLRRAAAGLPLRVKLVLTVVVLSAIGLVTTAAATTTALRSYLLSRVDGQLQSAAAQISQGGGPGAGQQRLPSDYYVVQFSNAGVAGQVTSSPLSAESPPKLSTLTVARATDLNGRAFTVPSEDGKTSWRVIALASGRGSGTVAVATSLADLQHTVDHLIAVELGIGGGVLILMGGAGYLLIRRSLRPLAAVENTAAAIANGDLSQRVAVAHPRTEIGGLSQALNGMLTQIEDAFDRERTSEQQARASEGRMRQFVADASHELRTPLTSIRGFTELYRMGAVVDTDELQRLMRRVEDEATRMGVLVEDLLLLARLDQQRPIAQAPVDLEVIAADVVFDAQAVAPDRQTTLVVATNHPAVIIGDDSRLRQVVHNLMTNALTHTPAGTPIDVRLEVDETIGRVFIEVADRGPGLSVAEADRVFERFYRADSSRSRQAGGNGLGLAIVAGLASAHGGSVSLAPRPGGGAIFRLSLPLAPADVLALVS